MRTNAKILFNIALFVAITAMITIAIMSMPSRPPMAGYINRKTTHPAYYPAFPDTPTVYCLGITAHGGQMAAAWNVPKEIYDSYEVGDVAGRPSNLKGGTR